MTATPTTTRRRRESDGRYFCPPARDPSRHADLDTLARVLELLLRLWPESKTEIDPPSPTPQGEEEAERHTVRDAYTAHRQDLSHSTGLPRCADCGNPIHPLAGGACLRCKYEADGGAA